MRILAALLIAGGLAAQEPAPLAIVRGEIIDTGASELSIRTKTNQVYRFRFDPKTYIERDQSRIQSSQLGQGDSVEIVSDRLPDTGIRYARLISVIEQRPAGRLSTLVERRPLYLSPTRSIFPRGTLTFTGVVLRQRDDRLLLRTRNDGEKLFLLRRDTSFLEGGLTVEPSALRSSTRVFVRAGKSLDGDLEAYEVIWGDILAPSGLH